MLLSVVKLLNMFYAKPNDFWLFWKVQKGVDVVTVTSRIVSNKLYIIKTPNTKRLLIKVAMLLADA
jgi:hypothetical protein